MTYQDTLDYLFSRLPMLQNKGTAAIKPGLERIERICEILDHPERKFKSIHVAGTNGKGSVTNLLASILFKAGYKVGLYTSPHFKDFRERIKVNGKCISKEAVISFVQSLKDTELPEPSFFEYSTAMAFDYFNREQVDFAIIETGLGGRLDSTNVVLPELSVITSISMDHMEFLGNTIEAIAGEKAGIIKPKIPVVVSAENQIEVLEVFYSKAAEQDSALYAAMAHEASELVFNHSFRLDNLALVKKSVDVLREQGYAISEDAVKEGIYTAVKDWGFFGRWYQDQDYPNLYYDVAHNEAGIQHVLSKAEEIAPLSEWGFVFGMVRDKDRGRIIDLLPREANYYLCQANVPRALDVATLSNDFSDAGLKHLTFIKVEDALSKALETSKNVLVFGSFFVVAEALPEKLFQNFS